MVGQGQLGGRVGAPAEHRLSMSKARARRIKEKKSLLIIEEKEDR